MTGAKRSSTPEEKGGLQKRSLTGAVITPNEVETGVQRKLCSFDAAQVLDVKVRQAHGDTLEIPSGFLGTRSCCALKGAWA
jgi:hypothetical protein